MKKVLIFIFVLCMLAGCNLPVGTSSEDVVDENNITVAPVVNMTEVVDDQITVNTPECTEQFFVVDADEPWVAVSLGEQTMFLYFGDKLTDQFIISSGGSLHPTPPGSYRVYKKHEQSLISENFENSVRGVWVIFFHHEYSIYGGDWNDKLGLPVTRGNINMSLKDAQLVYEQLAEESHVYIYK